MTNPNSFDRGPRAPRRVLIALPISEKEMYERRRGGSTVSAAAVGAPAAEAAQPITIPAQPTAVPQPASVNAIALLFFVAIAAILIDQITKWWVETNIPVYQEYGGFMIDPYFRLFHTLNRGAAFGMFQQGGIIFSIVAVLVSITIIYYNFQLPAGNNLLRVALGLQMGGALGNFVDRLRLGHVTDFLDFNFQSIINVPLADWPLFNFADLFVVTGVILLGWVMVRNPPEDRATSEPSGRQDLVQAEVAAD